MATAAFLREALVIFRKLQQWIIKNFLPVAFLLVFILAMSWPWPGQQVLRPSVKGVHIVTFINICIVFFISGLTLRTDELRAALTWKNLGGTIFGFVSIIGLTPLLGFAMRELSVKPGVFVTGLTIFTIVPTTLGVGISLVESANGNVGLAIFNTVTSNICGVFTVPLWLKVMVSHGSSGVENLHIHLTDVFVKLLLSVLVPTALGKAIREALPSVQTFVKAKRVYLSLISNSSLAMIIWQTLSGARELIVDQKFGTMLLVLTITIIVHATYLVFNTVGVVILRLPLPEAISTIILASQKSAPVAVTVITYITSDVRQQGLLALPCIVGQLVQIFLGHPLATYMKSLIQQSVKSVDGTEWDGIPSSSPKDRSQASDERDSSTNLTPVNQPGSLAPD